MPNTENNNQNNNSSQEYVKSSSVKGLNGSVSVPGDKSISHRSLILASQAIGQSKIFGLLEGDDVIATANCLRLLGVNINKEDDCWSVDGVGVGGLSEPAQILDMGNSGTGVRLMMGLVSSYPFTTYFTGDESLCHRPMGRVIKPLEKMGINFKTRDGGKLPLSVDGTHDIMPIEYELPVASAQVKSAILLAGLNCPGITTVIEPEATRDHTELMLKSFGADINVEELNENSRKITLKGHGDLKAQNIEVPGDPSSAAFLIVAALITPDSEVIIKNICINPLRTGLYTSLLEMGADIKFINKRNVAGDEVADIVAKYSKLKGVTIPKERAPSMIDEYPILSIAATCAQGETTMEGLAELKVKESDRLQSIADGLKGCGADFDLGEDYLVVRGGEVKGGALIKTNMDHRIAMSFLVMGMVTQEPVFVDDVEMINTSFPNFIKLVNELGGDIS